MLARCDKSCDLPSIAANRGLSNCVQTDDWRTNDVGCAEAVYISASAQSTVNQPCLVSADYINFVSHCGSSEPCCVEGVIELQLTVGGAIGSLLNMRSADQTWFGMQTDAGPSNAGGRANAHRGASAALVSAASVEESFLDVCAY